MCSSHPGGQWAAGQDVVVHILRLHSGQEGDTLRCHQCKFICVGRVLDPALRRNGSCPFGRPFMILDQNVVSCSNIDEFALDLHTWQLLVTLFFFLVQCQLPDGCLYSDLAGRPWSASWNKS